MTSIQFASFHDRCGATSSDFGRLKVTTRGKTMRNICAKMNSMVRWIAVRAPRWRRGLLVGITMFSASIAHAAWNQNATGTVTAVLLYASSGQILFRIEPMPTTGCPINDYFEISPTTNTDVESRRNMYAMLLAARQSGGQVTVGYDTGTSCGASTRPMVFALFQL